MKTLKTFVPISSKNSASGLRCVRQSLCRTRMSCLAFPLSRKKKRSNISWMLFSILMEMLFSLTKGEGGTGSIFALFAVPGEPRSPASLHIYLVTYFLQL